MTPSGHSSSNPPSPLPSHSAKAPPMPAQFLGRDKDLRRLKARLGVPDSSGAIASLHRSTIILGWPGVGKTAVTAALAHDPEIAAAFPDGVLWTSLGQKPSLLAELAAWGHALGDPNLARAPEIGWASAQLAMLLRNQRRLLIIDNVWEPSHVTPFQVGGEQCASLVTTRLPSVAATLARDVGDIYRLDVLKDSDALNLLQILAPEVVTADPESSLSLVQKLEGLPLAIQVAGRLLHTEARLGFNVANLLREMREGEALLLARSPADMTGTESRISVRALLQQSVDLLDQYSLRCFALLGVFAPNPATFSEDAMQALWEATETEARQVIRTLMDRGLIEAPSPGAYTIHKLVADYALGLLTG